MAEETRALGYICPECGKPVYGAIIDRKSVV